MSNSDTCPRPTTKVRAEMTKMKDAMEERHERMKVEAWGQGGQRGFLTPLTASPDPLRESLHNLSVANCYFLYKLCVDPPHTRSPGREGGGGGGGGGGWGAEEEVRRGGAGADRGPG